MNKKEENVKKIKISDKTRDTIINEAVNQYKEGKIKNSLDVEDFLDGLLQPLMQKLLDAELDNHLDYEKYEHSKNKDNSRNGYCKEKNVKTKYGNIKVQTPRDREATFDPIIIEKGQTKLTGFEDKCIALYAKGMSVRDIEKTLKEIYEVLGRIFFEKIAMYIVMGWCLLPILSIFFHIRWMGMAEQTFMYRLNILSSYQTAVLLMGVLTLEFLIAYFIGMILTRSNDWKNELFEFIKREPWNVFFLMLFVWIIICTMHSANKYTSIFGTEYRYEGLVTYCCYAAVYMCAHIVKEAKYRKCIFNTYAVTAVILGICLLLQDNHLLYMHKIFVYDRATVFSQFNHFGYYLNMSILVMTGLFLTSDVKKNEIMYAAGMAFQLFCLLVNNTFGAYLGSMFGVIAVCIMYVVRTNNIKKILVPIIIYISLSAVSMSGIIPSSSGQNLKVNLSTFSHDVNAVVSDAEDADGAGTGRMRLWKACLKMIPESPILGYGPEQLNEKYAGELGGVLAGGTDRPENEYIQYMVFMGIPGLVMYMGALISMMICQLKKIKKMELITIASAGCALAYAAGACFGNSMYYTTPYFYMFLGMTARTIKLKNTK